MTRRAALYARISSDDGLALGVERQRQDCQKLADSIGWTVERCYVDNDVSASNGKRRPAYSRMLDDLEAGRCDALVVWDVDRLTRTPVELEGVIDLAERHTIALASVGGEIDLATPQGRLTARIKASVARHEVEQSSRRIKRKVLERAEQGQPHGRIAYGWRREQVLDEQGRRLGSRDVIHPEQAAVVTEIARRVVGGESMRSICHDLNDRGVPSPNGTTWQSLMARQVVLRERNAGLRRHQGKVIGPGAWEPILDPALYDRVCAILRDPGRRSASPTSARKHLLSGLARCGLCGTPLRISGPRYVKSRQLLRPAAYVCPGCQRIRRRQDKVDELVIKLVTGRLAQPDAIGLLATADKEAVRHAVDQAAGIRARLDLVADQFAEGAIDGQQLARITSRLQPELERWQDEARAASAMPDLLDLATPDIAERWDSLPLDRKRAVIDMLVSIRVLPIGKTGSAKFDPRSVEITRKMS